MIDVEAPPKDDEKLKEKAKELVTAAIRLGLGIEPQGFIVAWATGVRVIVDRDDETGEVVGMAFLAVGQRWTDSLDKATLLRVIGDLDKILAFAKTVAKAAGSVSLFHEERVLEETEDFTRFVVKETFLD